MNTRIKELVEQAGGEFYTGFAGSPNSIKFMENDFEKFAELIIEECRSVVFEEAYRISSAITKHFGVDE